LLFAVHEPERPAGLRKVRFPLSPFELKRLGANYWLVVALATVFTLGRFSEAFLVLRAQGAGLPLALIPMVLVVMNIVYALSAYPAGVLSDHFNRLTMLIIGFALLIVADLVLAMSGGLIGVTLGVALWGTAHGRNPRPARHARSRYRSARTARRRLWHVQSDGGWLCWPPAYWLALSGMGSGQGYFPCGAGFTALALIGLGLVRWHAPSLGHRKKS